MKKRMTAVLVLFCMLICVRGIVFAAQSEPAAAGPDLSKECSIVVHLFTFDKEPVTDGSAMLIQVAELTEGEEGQYYKQNAGFGDLGFDPVEERFEDDTAEKLEKVAVQNDVPYTTAPFAEDGTAVFKGLVPGLYLLIQTEAVLESYTAMPACLALVPEVPAFTEDGEYDYDVDAFPKPVTKIPPIEIEFTGEKVIACESGNAPADTPFSFILTPETADQPMPRIADAAIDPKTGATVVTRYGAGAFTFGKVAYDLTDIGKTYVYTIREIQGTEANYTYDKTVFTITVSITANKDGEPQAAVSVVNDSAKPAQNVKFTNTYNPPPSIPQTGQLWWPIAVLGVVGLALIVFGVVRRRRNKA